mgnify:FL=1
MQFKNGFSLIEVLVALLVLKVGLLGILATQTLALKQVQNATQRTQAVMLAHNISNDLMQNPHLATKFFKPLSSNSIVPPITSCNAEVICSNEQLAENQIASLLQLVNDDSSSMLNEPVFCLEQSEAGSKLTISWWQRESASELTNACHAGAGRSWLTVNGAG